MKTEIAIQKIKDIEQKIAKLRAEKQKIKDNCEHLDYKPELIETFKWEHTPAYVCVVCGHISNRKIPANDQISLWRDFMPEWPNEKIEEVIRRGGYNC